MTTTGKKRAELKRLSASAKQNIFDMLSLANEILSDAEYTDQFGGEAQCMDDIEADEFSHFGGSPRLGSMLAAYRKFPSVKTWRENAFNVRVMIDLANPKEARDTTRIDWKAQAKELELQLETVKAQAAEQVKTITDLRRQIDELLVRVGERDGQIKVLEKFAPRAAA